MKLVNLQYIRNLVEGQPVLDVKRRPAPMPGKDWPTRVAWSFTIAVRKFVPNLETGKMEPRFSCPKSHAYLGRPNLYRAMEARNFLRPTIGQHASMILSEAFMAEFDSKGLVAYKTFGQNLENYQCAIPAFYAYHPHSTDVEIVEAFCKRLFVKYVGGMRLYSQKPRLPQEAIDAYYEWYKSHFKRSLRRPKATALAIVAGEPLEVSGGM